MNRSLPRKQIFAYGAFAFPLAFTSLPIYIHAPEFYATEYGVSLASLGVILLIMRLIDAVIDPMIGGVIDRMGGRYQRLSLTAMVLFVVSFYALFHPAMLPEGWRIASFAISLFFVTLAYSFLSILLNTLGGIWSDDKAHHTRITTVREGIGLVGLLCAAAAPSLLQREMSAPEAFHLISVAFSGITLVCGSLFLWWQKANGGHRLGAGKSDGSADFSSHSSNLSIYISILRSHASFYMTYFASVFASSIPAVLVLFFIRDRLGANEEAGLFLLLYFLAGAAGMPLWGVLSRKIGQMQSWGVSMALAIASFIWAYFLGAGDLWQYGVICAVSGVAFGAELSLPPAIVAGSIADAGNKETAGKQYALLMFCFKASVAVAAGVTFPGLEWAGYVPAHENSEAALHALSLTYALIPCGLKVVALVMLMQQVKREKHRKLTNP